MSTVDTEQRAHFGQTEFWKNRDGAVIRIDDMSVGYKRNVVRFVERHAPQMVREAVARKTADALITAMSAAFRPVPCVQCEGLDGDGTMRVHRYAHGVDHLMFDPEKYPDETDAMVDGLWDKAMAAAPSYTDAEAVEKVRATPLMRRLIEDVANNRGGSIA